MPPLLFLAVELKLITTLKSIEGIFRNGKDELLQAMPEVNKAPVFLMFLSNYTFTDARNILGNFAAACGFANQQASISIAP